MEPYTHYVVVRRDLALGVLLAMIAHAAGESFYKLASHTWTVPSMMATAAPSGGLSLRPSSSEKEQHVFSVQVGGSSPPWGSTFEPSHTVAIVLGARNEGRLVKLEAALLANGIAHAAIRETEGEHAGQLMAVGLIPGPKETLSAFVNSFHMLREL